MNSGEKVKHGALWSVLFAVVSLAWIFPIVLVIINSFKQKAYISRNAFSLPTGKAFVGLETAQLFTRTIHHAHIEVHTRISATEPTVMSRVQPKLAKKFVVSRPRV